MSNRDRWLAAALPAMLVLLVGWFFFLRPAGREVDQLRQRVLNQGTPEARRAQLQQAQAQRTELEESIAAKRRQSADGAGAFDRNWAMQQISLLCSAHGLSLNKSEPEPGGKLPAALREAARALAPDGAAPQVWRIEIEGGYPNFVKLLGGLQKAEPLIVPLNLSMQTGKTLREPVAWVLTLWL